MQYSKDGITVAVVLDKYKPKRNGLYPVRIRVTYRRQRQYYPTGKDLTLEQWERMPSTRNRDLKAIRESIELRQRIEPGRLAPEFTLARRDSSLVSLADYRGKVVVLDFWASWCRPCRASFPWVREFYEEYR